MRDSIKFNLRSSGGSTRGSAEISEPVAMALYQLLVFGIGMPGPSALRADAEPEARAFESAAQQMFAHAEHWLRASRARSYEASEQPEPGP